MCQEIDCKTVVFFCERERRSIFERKVWSKCKNGEGEMFSVHTIPEEIKNATMTGHFGFVFEKNSGIKVT